MIKSHLKGKINNFFSAVAKYCFNSLPFAAFPHFSLPLYPLPQTGFYPQYSSRTFKLLILLSFIYTCNYIPLYIVSVLDPSIKMKTSLLKHCLSQSSITLACSSYLLSSDFFPWFSLTANFLLPLPQIFFFRFLGLIPHRTSYTQYKYKNNIQLTSPDLAMIPSLLSTISLYIQNKFTWITYQSIN